MDFNSLLLPKAWTVTDVTMYLRELLESDHNLQDIWVQGEVSNFSKPRSGHLYFTVKDSKAALRCVMWRSAAVRQMYIPQDGDAVEVHGNISIYDAGGQYQIYVDQIRPMGEGALFQEFLRLKRLMEAAGYFDEERKRTIPSFPGKIGVVTSPTGAALRDILDTIQRRFPLPEIILAPTAVQGDHAPPGIAAALDALNENVHPDVILLARGGGSIEDLWAFNDPQVVEAIIASEAPVVTGVGHQTDFTLADFAADLRAPTPTAAAEVATPDRDDLIQGIAELHLRLSTAFEFQMNNWRWSFAELQQRLQRSSPELAIRTDRQRIDEIHNQLNTAIQHNLEIERTRILGIQQRLSNLSPQAVLNRGYAVLTQDDGSIVRLKGQASPGDILDARVSDGTFQVKVQDKNDE